MGSTRSMVVVVVVVLLTLTTTSHQKLTTTHTPLNGLEDSPLTEVHGVVGGRVLLPCDLKPSVANDSTHLVLFYHAGAGTPIYSVDARSVGLEQGSQWAEAGLGGRAYMRLDRGLQGLVLEEVQLRDEGHYRCRVDFFESPTRNLRILLKVIASPKSLTVTTNYAPDSRVALVAGPFPEGAEVTLSCQVLGGHPRPGVSWWQEGSLLDNTSEVMTGQVTRNALTLPPLTRSDLNKTLTCQASNSDLVVPLSHTVIIDMTYPPTWVGVTQGAGGRLVMEEGVARTISCEARGARPPARLTWSIDGKQLSHHTQDSVTGEESVSTVTLVPEPHHHGQSLTCHASSTTLPHLTITAAVPLQVLYKPRLDLRVEPHRDLREVEEGEDVTFVCHIDAHPPVTSVQWSHQGVPLSSVAGTILERLVLRDVTRGASGNYTCAAANSEGARTSNTLTLAVKFSPICAEDQPSVYGAARHEELHVPCSVLAHPPPSSFRWAVNTTTGMVDVPLNLTMKSEGRSMVRYTPQTYHDFGELLCWAVNDLGLQQQPCVFKVVPAAKPESVSMCEADRNATMPLSYVVLACTAGWDGGLNQTFTLEVRQTAREEVLEAFRHAVKPHFIIAGLKLDVEYLLTVTAANARGSSLPVTMRYTAKAASANKVVSSQASTHTLLSFIPLLLMAAGVVVVTACISVGVVVFKQYREHRQKPSANIHFIGSYKEGLENKDIHTIVCVKESEKEKVVKSHTPSGVVSNLYVTPSELLKHKCGVLSSEETDVLLKECPCVPPASFDSLGRCSTSTTKTSSSSATVALNPDFLARNPDYLAMESDKRQNDYQEIQPKYILNNPGKMPINPHSLQNAFYCLNVNGECLPINTSSIARDQVWQSKNCSSHINGNVHCLSRYPDSLGREEVVRLVPPQKESSV